MKGEVKLTFFKKIVSFVLLAATLFSFVSCEGTYQGPTGNGGTGGGNNGGGSGGEYIPPVMNDDPTDDFTVTVTADGEAYSPRMDMYVYWSDGFSIHTAKLDDEGVARIDGLDGDYKVTLSAVPNEYTYNPNANIATNDDRNIVVELYSLNMLVGGGTGMYDCRGLSKTGVYSVVIEEPGDLVFCNYSPDKNGEYSIESWIDTTADIINPYVEVYGGNSSWKYYVRTIDDGGEVGSYTINFVHTVTIADENISSGGQVSFTFAVGADSKNNQYPITVTFAVKRNGSFENPGHGSGGHGTGNDMAIPTYDFSDFNKSEHEYDDGEYRIAYPEYQYTAGSNVYVFDEERFKIWETKDGGDGFYHVYDEEKYASTDGYGPILYANITTNTRFIDRPFSKIEYNASGETINAALSAGGINYKHFIEGYTYLSTFGNINGGSYYCVADCGCHDKNVSVENWACTSACTECNKDCRRCPEELIGNEGYQSIANSDGMVPVTEELKNFFLAYCKKEIFFYDGSGTLEKRLIDGKSFQAVGDSGWLFACAYYEAK